MQHTLQTLDSKYLNLIENIWCPKLEFGVNRLLPLFLDYSETWYNRCVIPQNYRFCKEFDRIVKLARPKSQKLSSCPLESFQDP